MFVFVDRLGNREILHPAVCEQVEQLLLRSRIPPASVIVLREETPVPDSHVIDPNSSYVASLIEGYDIAAIRDALGRLSADGAPDPTVYIKKRLSMGKTGTLETEAVRFSLEDMAGLVENTIIDTCSEFQLIREGDGVLTGLSGGVDSSSLLLALASARKLPKFRLVAITFEDFDSDRSPAFQHARELAAELGVEHHLAPASLAQEIFHLDRPLREILPALMRTRSAHHVMYLDHHTTRRVLEVMAERLSLNRIALGLHTTDLVAGLLNGMMTGYNVANLPLRTVGSTTYIYPLAFVQKRELHLYHLQKTAALARHSHPNAWEMQPKDRNYYYYLADHLQSCWPGLEIMMFSAHQWRLRRQQPAAYVTCRNCGSALLEQPFTRLTNGECDACVLLRSEGFIHGENAA